MRRNSLYFLSFLVLFILSSELSFAQFGRNNNEDEFVTVDENGRVIPTQSVTDSAYTSDGQDINDFKFWYENQQPQVLDTSLTIKKYYTLNDTFEDTFGWMDFSNVGGVSNPLTYNPSISIIPEMGHTGKHFRYWGKEDVRYFDIKHPLTEFRYSTVQAEGHSLSTLFSYSSSKRFNLTLQYNGHRSVGTYNEQESAKNRFILSTHWANKSGRYKLMSHYAFQNIQDEHNGGILDLINFEQGNQTQFRNRDNIPTRLTGVTTEYSGRRFYFKHSYQLLPKNKAVSDKCFIRGNNTDSLKHTTLNEKLDSLNQNNLALKSDSIPKDFSKNTTNPFSLSLEHQFTYETRHYIYNEDNANPYYDTISELNQSARNTDTYYVNSTNSFFGVLNFWNKLQLKPGISYTVLKHELENGLNNSVQLEQNLKDPITSAHLSGKLILNTHFKGHFNFKRTLNASHYNDASISEIGFSTDLIPTINTKFYVQSSQTYPTLNRLRSYSIYKLFSFNANFERTKTRKIGIDVNQESGYHFEFEFIDTENFNYFDENFINRQFSDNIQYFRFLAEKDFKILSKTIDGNKWNLRLDNSVLFQHTSNERVMPLPSIVMRNTIYAEGKMFKKALFTQFGLSSYFFSKFRSNEFVPVISEFRNQNEQEIGNYPYLDVFVNAKVKRMRFTLSVQHFLSEIMPQKFYSAPRQPYRDWNFRIGLIWLLTT